MKKSFLVMICVVFVASIALVGLVGLNFRNTAHVYTNEIVCNEFYYSGDLAGDSLGERHVFDRKTSKGENYVVLDYVEVVVDGEKKTTSLTLAPQAYPEDASILVPGGILQSEYPYLFYTSSDCATVDETGTVTFTKPGLATVYISPKDRSDLKTTVVIAAVIKK